MSIEPNPQVSEVPGVIAKGRSNMPTETSVTVTGQRGVVALTQEAVKPQAQNVEVVSKLSVEEAKALRDELSEQIEAAKEC